MQPIGVAVHLRRSDEARDVMALASHFTEDAILLFQSSDMQRGRGQFASRLPTTTVHIFEVTSMELTVVGDTAYEVGAYQMNFTPQGSSAVSNAGKHLMVWKQTSNGTWRILRDMYNTSVPPPTPNESRGCHYMMRSSIAEGWIGDRGQGTPPTVGRWSGSVDGYLRDTSLAPSSTKQSEEAA